MPLTDEIGNRGESIFEVWITKVKSPDRLPLFRPHFLGDKFATLDFLVELVGFQEGIAYFFVQVKTTTQGYTSHVPKRLKIQVTKEDIDRMKAFPAPTYIVGVDEVNEQAYIASVSGKSVGRVSSLPTSYPLNPANLQLLWDEVASYWRGKDMVQTHSVFTHLGDDDDEAW
jgi:hypothetical protein